MLLPRRRGLHVGLLDTMVCLLILLHGIRRFILGKMMLFVFHLLFRVLEFDQVTDAKAQGLGGNRCASMMSK